MIGYKIGNRIGSVCNVARNVACSDSVNSVSLGVGRLENLVIYVCVCVSECSGLYVFPYPLFSLRFSLRAYSSLQVVIPRRGSHRSLPSVNSVTELDASARSPCSSSSSSSTTLIIKIKLPSPRLISDADDKTDSRLKFNFHFARDANQVECEIPRDCCDCGKYDKISGLALSARDFCETPKLFPRFISLPVNFAFLDLRAPAIMYGDDVMPHIRLGRRGKCIRKSLVSRLKLDELTMKRAGQLRAGLGPTARPGLK